MNDIAIDIAKTALRKMFDDGWFNICAIDKVCKITNTIPDKETYDLLHTLHCVHYKDMEPRVRQWCYEATVGLFTANGFDFSDLDRIAAKQLDVKRTTGVFALLR